jgi:dienelactone hydrolase
MTLRIAFVGALLASMIDGATAQQTPLSFSDAKVGVLRSDQAGELILPQGSGPFPAVIVLHGCYGVSPNYRIWARWLASWGYAALIIDSFRPRGIAILCGRGRELPPALRARDAFAAAAYLGKRSDIDPNRIGAIGFSHGGWSALFAAIDDAATRSGTPPLKAIVAFYPWSLAVSPRLATDVQILIGDADDWTPATAMRRLRWKVRRFGSAPSYPQGLSGRYPWLRYASAGSGLYRSSSYARSKSRGRCRGIDAEILRQILGPLNAR